MTEEKKKMKSRIISSRSVVTTLLGLCAVVLLQISCDPPPPNGVAKTNKLVITYAQLRISTPILVAEQQGYFKQVGLDVELKASPTGQTNIADLVAGSTPTAGYSALPIIFNAMTKTKKELVLMQIIK